MKWALITNTELRRGHLTDAVYEVRLDKCAALALLPVDHVQHFVLVSQVQNALSVRCVR